MPQQHYKSKKPQTSKELQLLQDEVVSLEAQILDLFEALFFFAGLRSQNLQDALAYYTDLLDQEDSQADYDAKSIIRLVSRLREEKPEWFCGGEK